MSDRLLCVSKIRYVHLRRIEPGVRGNDVSKRDNTAVYYVLSGNLECMRNGNVSVLSPGNFFVWDYADSYRISNVGTEDCVFYIIAFEMLTKELTMADFGIPLSGRIESDIFSNLFSKIYHIWSEKKNGYLFKVNSILYNILYNIISSNITDEKSIVEHSKINKAVQFIYENYNSEITIENLCKICGYSTPHLNRLFVDYYKMPPKRFINNYRISRAKLYLENRNYTLGEIAERVGINSTAYFCRLFKKYTSLTPSEYKKAFLNKLN